MALQTVVAVPRSRTRTAFTALLVIPLFLISMYFAGYLMWRFSGSNQWQLVREGGGARVYTLKEPGTDLEQVRGVVRVHSSLSGVVGWLQDHETCKDAGCYDAKTVERVDDQLQYEYFRFNMPGPFGTREFLLRIHFHQIPQTKEILVEYSAAPDRLPPDPCCFRVTAMSNTWRLTPVGDGDVDLEYTMNMDWGGALPDVMSNAMRPKYMFMQLGHMQQYLSRQKYQDAHFSFVQELGPSDSGKVVEAPPATHNESR